MSKVLIIEDEVAIADLEKDYLELSGFEVEVENSGDVGLERALAEEFDMYILDLMLPGIDGFEICKRIREVKNTPILMVSAKKDDIDKIRGLGLGADDYITKPFRPLEMIARVKSQLRRYQKYNPAHSDTGETSSAASEDNLVCGSLTMNIKAHTCFLGETPLVLTPTEFSILRILLENTGNVVSSEDLFHKIWQDEYYSKSNNTITVHIRHLREKMGDSMDKPRFIKTIWGVGYKIES